MSEKIGFGIVGCGGIARIAHLASFKEIPEAKVVAISRRTEHEGRRIAHEFGVENWYTDNNRVIEHKDVEAVIVATPPRYHKEITIACAKAGKHVLCEKPMAMNLEEADQMIDAAHKANVKLAIAEMKRFNPGFRRTKEILDAGIIGEPFMIRYHNSYYEPHVRKSWWVDPEISGGGEMMNELTHQVNTLRWLIGEVRRVDCMVNNPWGPPPEDNAVVSLKFQNGVIGVVTVSWMAKQYNLTFPAPMDHAWDERIDIFGTEGSIRIDTPFPLYMTPLQLFVHTEKKNPGYNKGWNLVKVPATNHYVAQITHFMDCIRQDKTPEVSGEEGRRDLEVVRAAYDSAKEGRRITLGSQEPS